MVHLARAGLTGVESAPARANRRCRRLCWYLRCLQPRDTVSRPIWHLNHLGPPRLDPVARAFLFSTRVRSQPARPAEQPGATAARRRRPQDTTRGPPSPRGTLPGVWGQLVAPVWTCVGPIPPHGKPPSRRNPTARAQQLTQPHMYTWPRAAVASAAACPVPRGVPTSPLGCGEANRALWGRWGWANSAVSVPSFSWM